MTAADGKQPCPPSQGFGEPIEALRLPTSRPIGVPPAQTSGKRTHADFREDTSQIGPPFTVQAHPWFPSHKSQPLIPRLLLLRSCLPLAYLDPVGGQEDRCGSRLFSARIDCLDDGEQEVFRGTEAKILIAESSVNNRLHAVENVQNGIYALCGLGQWVTLSMLKRLQAGAVPYYGPVAQVKDDEKCRSDMREWWRTAALRPDCEVRKDSSTTRRAAGAQLCLKKPIQTGTSPSPTIDSISAPTIPQEDGNALDIFVEEREQAPETMLGMIKSQYQEALYASKTSLAYFAKGPLSRARAAFHAHDGSSYDQSQLTELLRTSILPMATMDNKYRETLPGVIKDLPFEPLSEDESASVIATLSNKVRKSKKNKVGKNGLYPGEEVNITRWWLGRNATSAPCDSSEAREDSTKAIVLEQRARETQMQIIVALEVLALEACQLVPSTEQNVTEQIIEEDEDLRRKKKKQTKPQDLHTLLDLLIDRLCIWQSMSTDEGKASNKGERPPSQHATKLVEKTISSDRLRQFCVDVILPFYAARLPELTTLLCQKLGGLKQPSPKRPRLTNAATSQMTQKSGTAVDRLQARKPRRTLERVITDERSTSQRPPPSLSRSATEPTLPRLKREVSDTSLSSIPLNRVAMQKRYSQREVDLHAASKAAEDKLKKKAKIDHELQTAITALKKPNPRMAVKELVEDAEKRLAGSHSRKSKHPVRNPFAQGLQVMATPNRNRQDNSFVGLPRLPQPNTSAPFEELEDIPPSSISRIPSSTRKPSSTLTKASTRRLDNRVLPNVEQTPTRGPAKFRGCPTTSSAVMTSIEEVPQSSPAGLGLKPPSGPFAPHRCSTWDANIYKTPTKDRTIHHVHPNEATGVEATPMKAQPTLKPLEDALQADPPSSQPQEHEISIYASLGWDDVDELR